MTRIPGDLDRPDQFLFGLTARQLLIVAPAFAIIALIAWLMTTVLQLPLALTMMGLAGIVTPAFLNHNRVKFWLGIFIGSNFVTPGADPFTPLLLTVPLIVLFEVSIQVIRALRK